MVNTQTSISKKVLAVVLAVACMVCFTPSIAFTQDAHAANTSGGGTISSATDAAAAFGTKATCTASGTTVNVKLGEDVTATSGSTFTVASDTTLVLDLNSYKVTGLGADTFVLNAGANIEVKDTSSAQGGKVVGAADKSAIDATATTGTITIDEGATVAGGNATSTNTANGILTGAGTTSAYAKVVVNGTVAEGTAASGAYVYAVNLGGSATNATLTGTGTCDSTNPASKLMASASVSATYAAAAGTNTKYTGTATKLGVGNKLTATVTPASGYAVNDYTITLYKYVASTSTSTKVATGTGSVEYTVAADDAGATFYTIITQGSRFGFVSDKASAASNAGVVSKLTATLSAASAESVVGTTDTLTASFGSTSTASADANVTLQFYQNSSDSTTGGTLLATQLASTAKTYDATLPATAGTYYYYVVATDNDGFTATSDTVKVKVNAKGITTQPKAATYAIGDTTLTDLSFVSNVGSSESVQWYKSTTSATSGFVKFGTAKTVASNAVTPTAETTAATDYYYAEFTIPAAGTTPAATYKTDVVAVSFKAPGLETQPTGGTYAIGDTATVAVKAVGTTQPTVAFYSNTTNSTEGATSLGAGTWNATTATTTYTIPTTKAGTMYYFAKVTPAGTTTAITTDVVKVTVVAAGFSTQPKAATYVVGATADALSVAMAGNGEYYYQWFISSTNDTTVGTKVTGATQAAYVPSTDAAGTWYYYCKAYTNAARDDAHLVATSTTAKVVVAKAVTSVTTGNVKYTLSGTTAKAAKITKTSAKSITIAKTVSANGKTYKVTGIASKVFAKSKATTVTVKSTTLTKAGVKNCFKSSKVKTVKVPASKKSAYKKIFTKSNCGKTVTVK